MVIVRDIADAAVIESLRHHDAAAACRAPCCPDALTGTVLAGIQAEVLNRESRYARDDLDAFE